MKTVNKTIKSFLLLLASVGMLVSCSSEIEIKIEKNGSSESETDGPEFKLVVDPIKHFDLDKGTRTSKTEVKDESKDSSMYVDYHAKPTSNKAKTRAVGSIGEDAEDTIDNVWVLQYNGTGDDAQLVSKEFITEIGDDYIIKPKLDAGKEEDANTEQTICFIANTNNSSIFTDSSKINTLGKLKINKTRDYALQEELTNNGTNLPMAAVYTGKPTASIKEIKLERMVAKITFKYSLNLPEKHSFEPKAVQLQECSKGIHYIQTTEVKEEVAVKENYVDYDMVNLSPDKEITWYIAENLRGTIDNIKFPHQKGGISAPEFSSNIQIYGYYSRPNPNGEIESFPALYRVYLGMDNTKSFDTKRNHHYTISAKISNVKTTDKRVVLPNVALYYFAENNLIDVNKFVSEKDPEYPLGKLWNWGRNKPIDHTKIASNNTDLSFDDPRLWTDSTLQTRVKGYKKEDTWSSMIKQQMALAPKEYIGDNKDYMGELTGDPCPQGYHIPDTEEMLAISLSQNSSVTNTYPVKVRGIIGSYKEHKNTDAGYIVYALKFISKSTNNYLTAYRWEQIINSDNLYDIKITARYLGQAGTKVSLDEISNPAYWEQNNYMDINRLFPGGYINQAIKKPNTIGLYSEMACWTSCTYSNTTYLARTFSRYSTGRAIAKIHDIDKICLLPIRCVRN